VKTTNKFNDGTPRKLFCGAFQPVLETALAGEIVRYQKTAGPLAEIRVLVPTRLLALHLQRTLAPVINVRFQTLADFLGDKPVAAPLGLELLCRQLAREVIPADGYFAPVRDTPGFATALLATFTDLKEAGLATLPGKTPKLRELATAYAAFNDWLTAHHLSTEADLLQSAIPNPQSAILLYGFYDLNTVQRRFIQQLSPTAVFFPTGNAFSDPLLRWFQSIGYQVVSPTPPLAVSPPQVVSCPGESAEVREAVRTALQFVAETGRTFNDVAILCRSREQYDAILRDTLPQLGIPAYFRGGRPVTEHRDAQLVRLFLEARRSDYSRATVMELAGHVGDTSHWDARSVELGIVGGQDQWLRRTENISDLHQFLKKLFSLGDALPASGRWPAFVESLLAGFRAFGGQHEPVTAAIQSLAELETFQPVVTLDTFAEYCEKALAAGREQPAKFQGGGLFVSDVMGARGLSFPLVIVLGLVEKCFPRVIREDPLLLDNERAAINEFVGQALRLPSAANATAGDAPALQLKRRGYDEERLLFDLACAAARDRLVLSYPRLEAGTGRPRVPSFLLLETTGAANFKALVERRVPLSALAAGEPSLDEREFDLPRLHEADDAYLGAISPVMAAGVQAERTRWHERKLTGYDGLVVGKDALRLLRERFGLDKLVSSATALEHFFRCPFFYFQKHVLGIEKWEEPEAAVVIDPADLGTLYHRILEVYYRDGGQLAAVIEEQFRHFERTGVTGFSTVWEIKKEIIRQELAAFAAREQRRLAAGWLPVEFEQEFTGLAVAPPVRLRGKIDRVDRSADGQRARVLDYKTGKLPPGLKDDALAGGEALQLPLYLLAATQLWPKLTVEAASYLYFTLRGGYREISFSREALTARRPELTGLLETAATLIRDGQFAQYATPAGCRDCEFRPICGNGILKLYARKAEDDRLAGFRDIKENVA
jgi:RecB family exonuclease